MAGLFRNTLYTPGLRIRTLPSFIQVSPTLNIQYKAYKLVRQPTHAPYISSPRSALSRACRGYANSDPYRRRVSPNAVVGGTIALCTSVWLYSVIANEESTKPKQWGQRQKQKLELFRENFVASRANLKQGRWWTLVTHTFAHTEWWHLGMNMMALWSLGPYLIALHGARTFALVWLTAGAGGAAVQIYWPEIVREAMKRKIISKPFGNVHGNELGLGASGSISGLFGVLACTIPRVFMPQALLFAGFSAVCLTYDFLPGVGHINHLGSMAIGASTCLLFLRRARGW
jgi:membrane associated rhomboid family serine protease